MGKLYSLCALAFLWANPLYAQGYLFTWHGDLNVFQASFQVTAPEMQPGAVFNSPIFLGSMSVTNPLGQTYLGSDGNSAGSGGYVPWTMGFQLNDYQRSTELLIHSGDYTGSTHRTSGDMQEETFSGSQLFYERGYWSVAQIPEPSAVNLFLFAAGGWLLKRKTASNR